MMFRSTLAVLASAVAVLSISPAHAGNIADCEVVIMAQLEDGAAAVASFRDATDVIASIYDDERPTIAVIDGHPIRGMLCTRKNPVPDAEDLPIIASGIPLVISSNFDSQDAPTVTIALNEAREAVAMMAVGLSDTQQNELDVLLESYEPQEAKIRVDEIKAAGSEETTDEAEEMETSPQESDEALDDEAQSATSEE